MFRAVERNERSQCAKSLRFGSIERFNHWARAAHHADPVAATRLGFVGRKPANLSSPFADLPSAMQMPCRLFSSAWQLFERSNYCVISWTFGAPEEIRTPDPQIRRRNFYVSGPNDFCKLPIYRTYESQWLTRLLQT